MSKLFHGLLMIILLYAVMIGDARPEVGGWEKVVSQGVTDIAATFGKTKILVKITTHQLDIGKPSDERPPKIFSSCTYSRFPCSPVDYVEIFVNNNALFVPRSVYADLADVSTANLRQKKNGQFVLTLNGGDASESYTVDVTFDENSVRQRTLTSNEARQVMQKTIYFVSQSMNQ